MNLKNIVRSRDICSQASKSHVAQLHMGLKNNGRSMDICSQARKSHVTQLHMNLKNNGGQGTSEDQRTSEDQEIF
jgi:hypothetical protein